MQRGTAVGVNTSEDHHSKWVMEERSAIANKHGEMVPTRRGPKAEHRGKLNQGLPKRWRWQAGRIEQEWSEKGAGCPLPMLRQGLMSVQNVGIEDCQMGMIERSLRSLLNTREELRAGEQIDTRGKSNSGHSRISNWCKE
ncbi:unnamed protein product [Calypogeia fissa]